MRPSITSCQKESSIYKTSAHRNADRSGLLKFRPMTVDSVEEVRHYISRNRWRTCDYTIGGMLMWADYFDYQYCVVNNTLLVKGISENHPGVAAFSLPLGDMPLEESVGLLKDYCREMDIRLAFTAIPAELAYDMANVCGGMVEPLDGWSDYLYDAEALATLEGKKYSKKRNHVNRFMTDNPNFVFEMLCCSNLDAASQFIAATDVSKKTDVVTASYELNRCNDVLRHLDDYLFEGGVLYCDSGQVCAVCLGEVVRDTLYVHIEKMDHNVAGAGETINKLFASAMFARVPGLKYINREEDMGDEGLRYAKLSYHPLRLLDKCNVLCY